MVVAPALPSTLTEVGAASGAARGAEAALTPVAGEVSTSEKEGALAMAAPAAAAQALAVA
jgi:hypothetical protein